MALTTADAPSVIKTVEGGSARPTRLPLLEEIKRDGRPGTWYVLDTWDNPATARKFARGIARANTAHAKSGDPKCPAGRWEGGVEDLAGGGAEVRVRYLGDVATQEDPFA